MEEGVARGLTKEDMALVIVGGKVDEDNLTIVI